MLVTFDSSTFQILLGSVILYLCTTPETYSQNQFITAGQDSADALFLLIWLAFLIVSFPVLDIKFCNHLQPAFPDFVLNPFMLFSLAYLNAICQTFFPVSGKPCLAIILIHLHNSPSSFEKRTFDCRLPPKQCPSPFTISLRCFLYKK